MTPSDTLLEVALVHSDPDSEMRKQVQNEIRRIVHEEMENAMPPLKEYLLAEAAYRLRNDLTPGAINPVFRDGVLSVLQDHLQNPRTFNRRY